VVESDSLSIRYCRESRVRGHKRNSYRYDSDQRCTKVAFTSFSGVHKVSDLPRVDLNTKRRCFRPHVIKHETSRRVYPLDVDGMVNDGHASVQSNVECT